MAPATRRKCQVAGCNFGENNEPYITLDGLSTQDFVLKDLELHIQMAHPDSIARKGTNRPESTDSRPDRFPRPEISELASDTDWNYFIASWEAYKRATKIADQSACDQLWHCPSESLKKKIFDLGIRPTDDEATILAGIKRLSVRAHNNMVNIMSFQEMYQEKSESITQFAARLNGSANICDFTVTCSCKQAVSFSDKIQAFQLIRGISDTEIQERILSETASKSLTLSDIIKIGEAIETGKRSSGALARSVGLNRIYQEKNKDGNTRKCSYCGEAWHSGNNWRKYCKASNVTCHDCNKKGHLAKLCRSKKQIVVKESNSLEPAVETPTPPEEGETAAMGFFYQIEGVITSLSHMGINAFGKWAKACIVDHPEVLVNISPELSGYKELNLMGKLPSYIHDISCKALVDTGAQMVVLGLNTVHKMGLKQENLVPVGLKIKAANTGGLNLLGGVLVRISGKDKNGRLRVSKQLAYVASEVTKVFLSKQASEDLGIISHTFPAIGAYSVEGTPAASNGTGVLDSNNKREIKDFKGCYSSINDQCNCPKRVLPPPVPKTCPLPPTPENLGRLENWIRDRYQASTFNTCNNQPLPLMSDSPPLELFIDSSARPIACHKPSQVPIHFKEAVEKELRRDVRLGVFEEVPPNTPTTWCSRMCIQTKKSGKPRRVIDLQPLNKHAVRQTYTGESPFEIVSEIPTNTYRSTVDAWNGYHSVPIKEEDRHFTTFITPWGRFRYRTTPQGFLAAQDAYNHRFDLVTRDFKHKKRCVDDSIVWGYTIEEIFFRTCEYLTITGAAGIIMNPEKFIFAKKELEFLGFRLTTDGIEPGRDLLKSISEFPKPKDLSGVRSWFGLVEQVAWAFSKTNVMMPFRHLLSPSNEFKWSPELDRAFIESKEIIVEAVKTGVKSFNPKRITCMATDWSKLGIGFCLLQKTCECTEITPICCTRGWQLVFCASRYTSPAESRYAPVEGECLAVAWSLKKAKYFVLGCESLVIAVDHKPLLGILNDKSLELIENTRLVKLKEKTMSFRFSIIHVPGIKNKVADATSRYPVEAFEESFIQEENERLTRSVVRAARQEPDALDLIDSDQIESEIEATIEAAIFAIGGSEGICEALTLEDIIKEVASDKEMTDLIEAIRTGLNEDGNTWPESLEEYRRERRNLYEKDGIVIFKDRVVIPGNLRSKVLEILHGAHQGSSSMLARASQSVWWPKLCESIEQTRASCQGCIRAAPSQAILPPIPPPSPDFPMQQICSDIAHIEGKSFVVIVDRYTNWVSVYPANKTEGLIRALRCHFITHGAPEELASDGGPEYVSMETQEFLRRWRVAHRLSAAYNPGSNLRAELGVKIIKRLLRENIGRDGNLNTDKVGRALLTYRNTPCKETGLSPAQMLYGRQLKDHLPGIGGEYRQRREWIMLKKDREKALAHRYGKVEEKLRGRSRMLIELEVGDLVQIQNQKGNEPLKWDRSGVIIERLPHDQYTVRMDGSGRITLRNRRFLRRIRPVYPRNVTTDELDRNDSETQNEDVRRSIRTKKEVQRYQA